ncbi:hypothetical protein CHLNCDRAFT_142823 [Chlorella variabilis]|uniref:Uncharacterized protein n=1 Tax=Chlorella variabilis TaxID=554065 RepID=E1Z8U4_CHLVA|nr:hypothetical protein CHLNCDRAFT_142823 [Chlorella variabilis]EFN57399.1 hypothetical protein CHLNCDRAFT_142823 [Chlorella variabilis]|eukprot:XP_005849501.1 hypothetical protein CHLNCDRAFT_142823 [Chlorella variabilis]
MADFFADLLPKQPSNSQNGSQKPPSFEDDVLVSPTASSDQARASSSAAMSGGPMRKDTAKDLEGVVQAVFQRFSGSLQKILEDVDRRLESLENRTEHICQVVTDLQSVAGLREDAAKERLGGLEKTLREVHRSVQIIRDKQELAEASAELAKLASPQPRRRRR